MDCDRKPFYSFHPQFTKKDVKDQGLLKFLPEVDGAKQPMEVHKNDGSLGLEYTQAYHLKSFYEVKEDCNWAPSRIYKQLKRSLSGVALTAFDTVMQRTPWSDARSHTEENFTTFVDQWIQEMTHCENVADVQTNFYNNKGAFSKPDDVPARHFKTRFDECETFYRDMPEGRVTKLTTEQLNVVFLQAFPRALRNKLHKEKKNGLYVAVVDVRHPRAPVFNRQDTR